MTDSYKKYAEALLSVAKDANKVKEYKDNIDLLNDVFSSTKELALFLIHKEISKAEKKKLIFDSFGSLINKDCINFICLLIDKGHIAHFKTIFNDFHIMCNEELNIEEGVIYSKRNISDEYLKQIEKKLSDSLGTVSLKRKIDDDLISGFKIVLDNKVIDYSMSNKIDDLRNHLLKEGV